MNKKIVLWGIILMLLITGAAAFAPQDDINLRNYYAIINGTTINAENITADNFFGTLIGSFSVGQNINFNDYDVYNATNINATYIYQAGNLVLDSSDESSLNVNSSAYWDALNTPADIAISDLDQSGELDLNVNSSAYWDNLNSPSDINAGDINNDGTYILSSDEADLNVNSSAYWDSLNSPSDITGLSDTQISSLSWTKLNNYPVACPAGTFITQVGDTITCTGISDVYLLNSGDTGTGNYVFTGGTFDVDTLNTGQGDYELYAMDQDVETSSNVTFNSISNIIFVEKNNGLDIQTKIDSCGTEGCLIMIPNGDYYINDTITVSNNGVTLKGISYGGGKYTTTGSVRILADSGLSGKNMINSTGQRIQIQNLIIDGNNISRDGISFNAGGSVYVTDTQIKKQGRNGIFSINSMGAGNGLNHVTTSENGLHGAEIQRNDWRINDYYSFRNRNGAALMLNDGGGMQLVNMHSFYNKYGIYLNGTDASSFTNIELEQNTHSAVYLDSIKSAIKRNTFINGIFYLQNETEINSVFYFDSSSGNLIEDINIIGMTSDDTANFVNYTGSNFLDVTITDIALSDSNFLGAYPDEFVVDYISNNNRNMYNTNLIVDSGLSILNSQTDKLQLRRFENTNELGQIFISDYALSFNSTQDEASGDKGGFDFFFDPDPNREPEFNLYKGDKTSLRVFQIDDDGNVDLTGNIFADGNVDLTGNIFADGYIKLGSAGAITATKEVIQYGGTDYYKLGTILYEGSNVEIEYSTSPHYNDNPNMVQGKMVGQIGLSNGVNAYGYYYELGYGSGNELGYVRTGATTFEVWAKITGYNKGSFYIKEGYNFVYDYEFSDTEPTNYTSVRNVFNLASGDLNVTSGNISGSYKSSDGTTGYTGNCVNASYKDGIVVGCND